MYSSTLTQRGNEQMDTFIRKGKKYKSVSTMDKVFAKIGDVVHLLNRSEETYLFEVTQVRRTKMTAKAIRTDDSSLYKVGESYLFPATWNSFGDCDGMNQAILFVKEL